MSTGRSIHAVPSITLSLGEGNRRWAETPSAARSPALIIAYWPKTAATGAAGRDCRGPAIAMMDSACRRCPDQSPIVRRLTNFAKRQLMSHLTGGGGRLSSLIPI